MAALISSPCYHRELISRDVLTARLLPAVKIKYTQSFSHSEQYLPQETPSQVIYCTSDALVADICMVLVAFDGSDQYANVTSQR